MAWCPKCKLEYRDEIKICSDCGSELVACLEEERELTSIMSTEDEELAKKFLEFLKYSEIASAAMTFQQETEDFAVSVAGEDTTEAKKLFKAFYVSELEENESNPEESEIEKEITDENVPLDQEESHSSGVYVKREDKYNDLSSTAKIFYVFGVLGLAFVALNISGFISFIHGAFSYVLYSILFSACLFVGFITQKSAKSAKEQIGQERDLTNSINIWLGEHMTDEVFRSIDNESVSEEVNYLNRTDYIKKQLLGAYNGLDDSYADQLIEDYYNEHF
ncbi:MAG: hypothetical protein RSB37_07440 [Acetivibrio sp.]